MTRDIKIVSAAMLTWGFGEGMFFIFQPLYIQQFGADPIMIGTILGINGFVMAISQVPSGILADKFGRRRLMWFSWFSGAAATWMMALAPSLGYFVAGLFLYGFTSSVMAPLNSYVQEARGSWSVGKAVSFMSATYNIGGVLGPLVGGIVGQIFNLRMVYYGSAVIFTISTVIVMFAGKQEKINQKGGAEDIHFLRNQAFVGLMVTIFLVMFAVVLPQPLTANFLQNQRGLSINKIGQLGALGALGSAVLMLVFGHLRADMAMMIGQFGVLLFAGLIWLGGGIFWYGAAYFFLGGYRLCRAMTLALARPLVREFEVGFAFGVVESLNSLAFMLAPVIAGWIYNWRPVVLYPISAGVLIFSMMLSYLMMRRTGAERAENQDLDLLDVEIVDEA
jgi:predicted MFS family arabinose efflux permease